MKLDKELLLLALEEELEELEESNRRSWDRYGSELCAGDMSRKENNLRDKIKELKESLF